MKPKLLHSPLRTASMLALLSLAFVLAACSEKRDTGAFQKQIAQQMATIADTSQAQPDLAKYTINIGDELDIKFNEREDFNSLTKVRTDGKISMRLIGDVLALGKTSIELEGDIREKYRELGSADNAFAGNSNKTYMINVNDELTIKFPFHANMEQTVKVRPDGFISLSLINEVAAEHKTPEVLEAELNRKYSRYLKNPNITVVVKQFSSFWYERNGKPVLAGVDSLTPTVIVKSFEPFEVFVAGNVNKPGIVGYRPTLTAMAAIIEAGGQKQGSEMGEIVVLRKGSKKAVGLKLNLSDDNSADFAGNVRLQPFDVVYVPKTDINQAGDFVQELGRIVPMLKNSSFSFIYDVLRNVSSESAVTTQR